MSSERRLSRRTLLGAAGAAVAATALPVVPALSPLSAEAAAADPQTNLEKLVNMRFGMFNRFSGLSLNVDSGSTADGANINQFTYNRAPEEQWQIVPS